MRGELYKFYINYTLCSYTLILHSVRSCLGTCEVGRDHHGNFVRTWYFCADGSQQKWQQGSLQTAVNVYRRLPSGNRYTWPPSTNTYWFPFKLLSFLTEYKRTKSSMVFSLANKNIAMTLKEVSVNIRLKFLFRPGCTKQRYI